MRAGARIAAGAGGAMLYRKRTETRNSTRSPRASAATISSRIAFTMFLDIPLIEMRLCSAIR